VHLLKTIPNPVRTDGADTRVGTKSDIVNAGLYRAEALLGGNPPAL